MAELPKDTIYHYESDGLNVTITMTELVRCKNCKYRNGDYCHCYDGFAHGGNFFFVRPDDFCSRGEKDEVEE